jgi:hypothetical protein
MGGVDGQHQFESLEPSTFLGNGGSPPNDDVEDDDVIN